MRRIKLVVAALAVVVAAFAAFAGPAMAADRDDNYNNGYSDPYYNNGYSDPYYNNGYSDPYYNNGYSDPYYNNYGYNSGNDLSNYIDYSLYNDLYGYNGYGYDGYGYGY